MCVAFEAGSDFAQGGGRATLLVPPLSPASVCVPLQSADTLEKVRGIISEQLGMELDKVRCAAAQKGGHPKERGVTKAAAVAPFCRCSRLRVTDGTSAGAQVTAGSKFVDLGADSLDTVRARPASRRLWCKVPVQSEPR